MIAVIGVDPGLVHTGLVRLELNPVKRTWSTGFHAVLDLRYDEIVRWCKEGRPDKVFIEAYRPRSHFQSDARMVQAVHELKQRLPGARVLDNTGVTKVVTPELLQLLGLWKFSMTTHHQDLRSAARIAILGLLKNEQWNQILAELVMDHVDGNPWSHI